MADKQFEIAGIQRIFPEVSSGVYAEGVSLAGALAGEDLTNGVLRVGKYATGAFSLSHNPGAGTQATISQPAGAAGVRNVLTDFSFGIATNTSAPTATILTVNLRDGATGAGTVLKSWSISVPNAVGYNFAISKDDLWIEGSAATALTLEFSGSLANCLEYCNLGGVQVS